MNGQKSEGTEPVKRKKIGKGRYVASLPRYRTSLRNSRKEGCNPREDSYKDYDIVEAGAIIYRKLCEEEDEYA